MTIRITVEGETAKEVKDLVKDLVENLFDMKDCEVSTFTASAVKSTFKLQAGDATTIVETETVGEQIRFEDLQKVFLTLSRDGKGDSVRKLFAQFGVKKLSEIPAENYNDLHAEAVKL